MSQLPYDQVRGWYRVNDGTRTLAASVVAPEVRDALKAWSRTGQDGVLIGGLALSYWSVPRHTQDIDVLMSELPSPPLDGFKRTRPHAWIHLNTGVEVETLSPRFLNHAAPTHMFDRVLQHSVPVEGVRVAKPVALVALKLGRFSRQDQADIENLLKLTSKEEVMQEFGPLLRRHEVNRLHEF